MRLPRRVTLHPMAMPSRSLNWAIDLRARVMCGRWPAITASCSTASSRALLFGLGVADAHASVIFSRRGCSIGER